MKSSKQIPPSIAQLEIYLIQLQEVLRRRQEAAAATEIAKMQLQSVEAQAQRNAELDRVRVRAETDHAIAREAVRSKVETERIQQEAEVTKARLAAETQASRTQALVESARVSAEALKTARMENIREHSRIQIEADDRARIFELTAAREELQSHLLTYREHFEYFPELKAEIERYLAVGADERLMLEGVRVVHDGIGLLPRFLDLMAVLRQVGVPAEEAATLLRPSGFASLRRHLDVCTRNVETIPAVGLEDWQPIDKAGVNMAPWSNPSVVSLWKERGKSILWAVFPEPRCFDADSGQLTARAKIDEFNSTSMGARSNWSLATVDELRRISQTKSLSLLGADKVRRAWASYASASGRVSSYCFIDGKRETTGERDKCSIFLVSI